MRRVLLVLAGAVTVAACASVAPLSPVQAAEMNSIRAACAAMGLNPSEAPFVYCVRSLEDSAPPLSYARTVPATTGQAARPDQAESACAAIGLDPATARFSSCVGNLRATLDQANAISTN